MIVEIAIIEKIIDADAPKGGLLYFAALACLFTVSTAPIGIVSQIRLDVNLIIFHLEF
jgi:hypothetical protein